MAKKFVVATDEATPSTRNSLSNYMKGKSWGYWHWFADIWLLDGVPDRYTPQSFCIELRSNSAIDPDETILVLDVTEGAGSFKYWGRAQPDAWKWLSEFWGKPG